jgi:thiol-disulfide isomerase/thioredoxin
VVFIGIIAILYFTGLHTPVMGFIQGLVLKTGVIQPGIEENPTENADYNFLLTDRNGDQVSFDAFRNKVVFLNFWATWCPPCIAEMPDINNLYQEVDKSKIVFVMISLDKSFESAKAFVDKKGYDFPIYTLKSSLPEVFSRSAIPTTFVVSPEGKIVVEKQGMAKYNTNKFKRFLKEMTE